MLWTTLLLAKRSTQKQRERSAEPAFSTLDQIRPGREVTVVRIVAGHSATRQLAQLGIRPGTKLTVQRSAPLGGPVLVDCSGIMVAIGRGMARKVDVQVLE
jgi:ferrous iron transport protein A